MAEGTPHLREEINTGGVIEEVLRLFSSERRRIAIHILHEADSEASGRAGIISHVQLAEQVTAVEEGCHVDCVDRRSRKSAKVGLRQNHLPVLDEFGVVEWNEQSGSILTTTQTQAFGRLLKTLEFAIRRAEISDTDRRRS
ncbi:hypothetical protein PNP85_14510 [Halobacterium salinarum]|uniref:DUF7344 domain-containing protein n=1 Tax=Halobacterium salinarum TaxID=2242 RepID=UPI002554D050|nr:hypothetical protein [Halobacterium salinarum]MDL0124564.1 hypothetical protein [Halobacterium salinarum]MDL0135657.1 hypothetical protein [Halobacterium salinarum]MDL0140712.1 hypothetical protein [Halobacterium salinarum]